jgi:protein TonB
MFSEPKSHSPRTASTGLHTPRRPGWMAALLAGMAGLAAIVAGCKSSPPPTLPPAAVVPAPPAAGVPAGPPPPSGARTPREYRKDAAGHLYKRNAERIYKGRLPPLLYAIGTLEVEVDRRGNVTSLHWLRAPKHAPEVVKEIERTVRQAAPYPVAERLGKVTYTDTWLWDKSGRFQLDTLTEGQD